MTKTSLPAPWPTLDEAPALDLQIFTLRRFTVQHPTDGSRHPRVVLAGPDWVNVIPLTAQGEVVLVRQYRVGIQRVTLEIPGGMVDAGEAPADAAARELEEETGYRAARLVPLGTSHPNPALQDNLLHTFLALDCAQVHGGRPDPGEELAVALVPRAQLDERVRRGEITHALVLAGLYLAHLHAG